MAFSTVRHRMRRIQSMRYTRRQMRKWDGFSLGIIAILAGVTLILASLAIRYG